MVVAVIGNGSVSDYAYIKKYMESNGVDMVIACDGGLKHCDCMGIKPDCLLGDFDSVDEKLLEKYKDMGINALQFPTKKDKTDIEIGIEVAFEQKPERVIIFGGMGSRMDHSLTNVHLLMLGLDNHIKLSIVDEHNEIYAVKDSFVVENKINHILSLIPLTVKVEGVTTAGLEYPLEDYTMEIGSSLGVSNVVVKEKAEVKIKKGILLVMLTRD